MLGRYLWRLILLWNDKQGCNLKKLSMKWGAKQTYEKHIPPLYNDSTILDKGYQGTLLYRLGNGCAQVGGASWMWGKHPVNHQMNFWHTMNFIVDTLGASLLSECLSDLCTSFYRWHFGLPFWELFLDTFWASILGVFRGKFLGLHFGTTIV